MKVLVCGGRDFLDYDLLCSVMNDYVICDWRELTVIQGEAIGADFLAKVWAYCNGVSCEGYPAEWKKYGKRAGFLRNKEMLYTGQPDMVIAMPGGDGTRSMIGLSLNESVKTIIVEKDGTIKEHN